MQGTRPVRHPLKGKCKNFIRTCEISENILVRVPFEVTFPFACCGGNCRVGLLGEGKTLLSFHFLCVLSLKIYTEGQFVGGSLICIAGRWERQVTSAKMWQSRGWPSGLRWMGFNAQRHCYSPLKLLRSIFLCRQITMCMCKGVDCSDKCTENDHLTLPFNSAVWSIVQQPVHSHCSHHPCFWIQPVAEKL